MGDKIKEDNQRLSRDLELKDQDVVQSAGNEKKTEELQGAIMKMEKQMDKMQDQNKKLTGDLEKSRQEKQKEKIVPVEKIVLQDKIVEKRVEVPVERAVVQEKIV